MKTRKQERKQCDTGKYKVSEEESRFNGDELPSIKYEGKHGKLIIPGALPFLWPLAWIVTDATIVIVVLKVG